MSGDNTTSTQTELLETLVRRHLLRRVGVRRFRVLVREQGLVLQGLTPTYYARQPVQHAAMEVRRLPLLANEIEVRSVALRHRESQ